MDTRAGENPAEFFSEIVAGVLLPRLKLDAVFVGNVEHKNRVTCLEILERTPRPDHAKQYLPDIFQTLISLLERDTEEVAIVALRILGDLHRGSGYDIEAPAFLEVIKRAHRQLPSTVGVIFATKPSTSAQISASVGAPGSSAPAAAPGTVDQAKKESANEPKVRAEHSLKILTETSNSILFLFKNLPAIFNLTEWVHLMINTLQVVAPENAAVTNRPLYSDLVLAQTKTFSLLCHFLVMVLPRKDEQQTQAKLMEVANALPQLKVLPQCVVKLLRTCPPEAIATRKDIIVALRQLITAQSSYLTHQTSIQPNSFGNPAISNPGWLELWSNFLAQLDYFLDEKILVGTGRTAHETLRSYAWSVVAEYVNQSRNKLSLTQLTKLVGLYGKHIHDATLPASSISFSLRLLSKLAEVIAMPDPNEGPTRAQLLTKILDIFVNKLSTMKRQLPSLLLSVAQASQKAQKTAKGYDTVSNTASAVSIDQTLSESSAEGSTQSSDAKPKEPPTEKTYEEKLAEEEAKWSAALESIKDSALAKDEPPSPMLQLTEMRSMVSTTINVIKTAVTQLQNHHMTFRPSKFALVDETYILNRLVRNTMRCLSVYDAPKLIESKKEETGSHKSPDPAQSTPSAALQSALSPKPSNGSSSPSKPALQPNLTCAPGTSEQFEKDCTTISGFLINLDTNTLEDLLTHNLPYIYSCILEFPFLAVVLQALMNTNLPAPSASVPTPPRPYIRSLNDIVLNFLISKIPTMGNAEPVEAGIIQRLFKVNFQTIGRQLDDPPMSPSWAPLLSGVVSQVLRLATETKDPLNLFILLRYLFRNIPKHDIWSKELAHQLPTIIDTINRIQENTSSQQLKDLLIELPLTLPLRLSTMLPCFKLFLKPLLAALEAPESEGYVYQTKLVHALRFLEGYIGQFTTEFFEPLIAEHKARLLRALWRHMRQPPGTFTSQVMRILGKMGGRIRPYAIPLLPISVDDASTLTLALTFDSSSQLQSGTTSTISSSSESGPTIQADPSLNRETKIIELPLLDAILSARRILFFVSPVVSAQITARKLSAFNFLKSCLFALLRPYADSPSPTKNLKTFSSEDLCLLEPIEASHPLKLLTQPQYPSFVKIKDPSSLATDRLTERVKTVHQLNSERHSLKMILSSLITSVSTDSLRNAATELLEMITTHFAVLFLSHSVPNTSNLLELDPLTLVDAITDVLASENRDHAPAALAAIDMLVESCLKMDPEYVAPKDEKRVGGKHSTAFSITSTGSGKKEAEKDELNEGPMTSFMLGLPVLTHLVQRLCDVCFKREWYYKVGGCLGIRHLMTKLPTAWIRHHQLAFLQAILFVLQDYPLGATVSVTEDASQTFLKVLRASNSMGGQIVDQSMLDDALLFLATHLTSTNALVRKNVQSALDKLAEWSGSEVTELLEPHKKLILEPILQHPLSRVSAKLQQAHLDAVAYCLSLRPPLIPDLPELHIFLVEALALAESEETIRNVPLATALVDSLAAAVVGWKPFQSPEHMDLRTKTIAMFLKTLSSQNRPLIQCAKRGLEQVVAADLMSRKTLQDVVSPTLTSLTAGKLTEHMLECLGRYLSLFPKFFTHELGKKLLDQLAPYTSSGDASDAMTNIPKLEPNESPLRVTAAVMELCHLLPQANKLLERVVECTLSLEARSASWTAPGERRRISPKELTSVYRAPLAKYLNRLPQEALTFFLAKLHDPEYTSLFVRCLKSEHAPALREELSRSSSRLIDAAFTPQASAPTAEEAFQMQYSGILLIKALLKFYPDWLSQQKDILNKLYSLWNAPQRLERLAQESHLSLRHSRETTYLIKCLLQYLRQNHHDSTLFLDLISALSTPYCHGLFELQEFYQKYSPEHYTIQEKRTLLERVLADFAADSQSPSSSALRSGHSLLHKQQILKSFVIRVFEVAVEKNQDLLTKELISLFLSNLFTLEQDGGGVRSFLAHELLSILGLMLKNAPSDLEEHLKDLIRFGWNFQRNEDPYTKQNANYLFSAIIKDRTAIAPPRIRITVYAALMRSYQSEVRASVREALDMLVPVLLAPSATPDQQYIKWTRKVLYEESQVPHQLFHILYVLAKYETYFRPWRSMFYSSLATSFPKLAPHSPNTPTDQRKLAIAIIDLLLTWERMRIKNSEAPKDTASTPSLASPTPSSSSAMDADAPAPSSAITSTDEPQRTYSTPVSTVPPIPGEIPVLDYGDGKLPLSQTEHILSTLMTASLLTDPNRAAAAAASGSSSSVDLSFVFMKLVKEALEVWPAANMKLNFIFARVLDKPESTAAPHARALLLLDTIFRAQPATIVNYSQELARSLPQLLSLETPDTNRALCQLLQLLLSKYPIRVPGSPLEPLYNALLSELDKVMQAEKPAVDNILAVLDVLLRRPSLSASLVEPETKELEPASSSGQTSTEPEVKKESSGMDVDEPSIPESSEPSGEPSNAAAPAASTANAMDTDSAQPTTSASQTQQEAMSSIPQFKPQPEPDLLHPLTMPLLKLSSRLKDIALAKPETQDPSMAIKRPDSTPLLTIFKILARRLESMQADFRRFFMSLIYGLFDKSTDEQFLLSLISFVESLPLDQREANTLLQRMRRFDRSRTGPISEAYFNLIFSLYSRFKSAEIASLEPSFMSVLTARDPAIRSKFIAKFESRLPKGFVPLFESLLRPQTWEALPHLFWVQPSVEILLSQADASLPATLGCAAARVTQPRYAPQTGKSSAKGHSQNYQSVLDAEKTFMEALKSTSISDLLRPLTDLVYQDPELAGSVWSSMFQGAILSDQSGALKRRCWQHIQSLLSQDSGTRGQRLNPMVANYLLRSAHLAKLHLPPSLVKYVGTTYHAWHLAMHILEERITAGFNGTSPDAPPGVVVNFPNHPPLLYQSLGDMYSRLYEEDFTTALLINQSVMEDTRCGLILQQQGAFSRAQEVFFQGMQDSSKGLIENVPEAEQTLWETQWIECAKRLNQWDVVASYSKSIGTVELAADAAWKLGDWETLKHMLGKFPSTDTPKSAALQAYSLLSDKNPEVDSSHAMNLVLTQWVNLPRMPCPAFTPLLVTLQRFIDIHDSIKIVKDLKTDFISKIMDIKQTQLRLWRERLPHDCDDMTHWHDVLQWRQHMFSMLTAALSPIHTPPQQQPPPVLGLGHHEAAWAINKMAHIARKQGLVDICFTSLPKIYELPNIEVQDAFTKVCEHIKCYFRLPLPATRGILDIINTTNLNYFSVIQKAEFFHLKADYYARTGAFEEAAKAYSTAVLLYPSLPKVWTGWGKFYDERFEALLGTMAITSTSDERLLASHPAQLSAGSFSLATKAETPSMDIDENAPTATAAGSGPASMTAPPKSRLTAAHYALSCYLLALKANPQISSRKMLVRVLWLLGYDDELCCEEATLAAEIGAAASAAAAAATAVTSAPATPSVTLTSSSANIPGSNLASSTGTLAIGSLGDVSSPSGHVPAELSQGSKKREAPSPAVDEDHNPKKRKLTETDNADAEHQVEESTASAAAPQKMEVDTNVGLTATPVASTPVVGSEKASLAFSGMMVPPTPNTPATPSVYMIAATPATPSASTVPPTAPTAMTGSTTLSSATVTSASTPPPDPILVEISRVRKMRLLCTTFCEHLDSLPVWIWLIWIPQLLTGLDRPEALAVQTVLKKVVTQYPFAVFFPLRTWIMERKHMISQLSSTSVNPVTTVQSLTTERMGLRMAEDLMLFLKERIPAVVSDLERMCGELEQLASLSLPEALLDALSAILKTSYDVTNEAGDSMSLHQRRSKLSMQLQLVYSHLFPSSPSSTGAESTTQASESSSYAPVTRSRGRTKKMDVDPPSTSPPPSAASILTAEELDKLHPYSSEVLRAKLQPKFEEDFGAWLQTSDLPAQNGSASPAHMIPTATHSANNKLPSIRSTVVKIKSWIAELRSLTSSLPTWAELRNSSWLAQLQSDNGLEMPAIYYEDKEMSPDTCVYIDKFESPVRISQSNGLPRRMVTVRGSNGQFYHWFVQSCTALPVSLSHIALSASVTSPSLPLPTSLGHKSKDIGSSSLHVKVEDEVTTSHSKMNGNSSDAAGSLTSKSPHRYVALPVNMLWQRESRHAQMMRVLNRIIQKEIHVRKRAPSLVVPSIVSLSPSLRIVSVDKEYLSMDDAVTEWHHKQGTSSLSSLSMFDDLLGGKKQHSTTSNAPNGTLSAEAHFSMASKDRLLMYDAACRAGNDEAFMRMIYMHLGDHFEGVWHIRKTFMANLAQHLLFQYLLSSTYSATPENLLIAPASGSLQCFNLFSSMDEYGGLIETPPSPFRLTPNLLRFIGPCVKGSLLDATLVASTIALSKPNPRAQFSHHLHLFLRDDLLDIHRHNIQQAGLCAEVSVLNPTNLILSQLKRNVKLILARLSKVAPASLSSYRPNTTTPINLQLEKLIDAAMDPLLASKMPVGWAAWV